MADVVVTGGLGYLGALVAARLSDAGHTTIGVDNRRDPKIGVANAAFKYGVFEHDIHENGLPFADSADAVVHLAALPGVETCAAMPAAATAANVRGTALVAEACYEHKTPLVFASSIGVYGNADVCAPGRSRGAPNFYLETKRAGEDVIAACSRDKYPAITMQMSNLYGQYTLGDASVQKGTVINQFISMAQQGEPLTVHTPGSQTRDFLHVSDAADSFVAAVDSVLDGGWTGTQTLPLASGDVLSVLEVAEYVDSMTGVGIDMVPNPRPDGDARQQGEIQTARAVNVLDRHPLAEQTVQGEIKRRLRGVADGV